MTTPPTDRPAPAEPSAHADPSAQPDLPAQPDPPAQPDAPAQLDPSAQPSRTVVVPSFGLPPTQPAPPTYDPTLLMAPVPVSAPYMPALAPPPPSGPKTALLVLSVLLGLFVLASVTLGVLYVRQGQESTRMAEQIADLEADNVTTQRQLRAAERDLAAADEDLSAARTERDAVAGCLTAIYDWWDALEETDGTDTPATEQLRLEASRLCREADQYL